MNRYLGFFLIVFIISITAMFATHISLDRKDRRERAIQKELARKRAEMMMRSVQRGKLK